TPLLIGIAGNEKIVDNNAIYDAAKRLPSIELAAFANAEHELLMERDTIRSAFLQRSFEFFKAQD
ncbi:MAG: alpha/beta fold hydrolase, partial [Pseudomonadota bacterium]